VTHIRYLTRASAGDGATTVLLPLLPLLSLLPLLLLLIAPLTVALAGCGRQSDSPPAHNATPPASANAGDAANGAPATSGARPHAAPDVLTIAPEMLRDLRITTLRIDPRTGAEAASLLGELRVDERRYAEIGSPIVSRTLRLLAAPGDRVKPGDGLAVLHSVELGKARAEFIAANAHLEFATRTLARKRDLANERITPLREVQEAEAQKASAEAEVHAARAALTAFGVTPESADTNSQFVLRSPIAGTVLDRAIATGQMVDPAKPLFRIADLARVWLVVHAFERDAVRLTEGAQARVTLPALPGRTFQGRVSFIGREVDASSRTIPIRIELSNADGLLRPGMSASASLAIGATPSTLMVPAAALQRVSDQWCVFIPRADAPATFTIHAVGRGRDFGNDVEVLSGLRPGDTIVVEGAFLLRAEAEKARGGGSGGDHDDH
jgi:cobalt-zinc-cadmium efflux system membrane fusion protein